jgi:hypothetical protein
MFESTRATGRDGATALDEVAVATGAIAAGSAGGGPAALPPHAATPVLRHPKKSFRNEDIEHPTRERIVSLARTFAGRCHVGP